MARRRPRRLLPGGSGPPTTPKRVVAAIRRFTFMSTSLIAQFFYMWDFDRGVCRDRSAASARTMTRRDLSKLVADKALKSFTINNPKGRGAPEKVFCLAGTRIPRDLMFMPHLLEVNSLALTLEAACSRPRDVAYTFDFLLESDRLLKRGNKEGDRRPDLVFTVASSEGRGLYLAELDRGQEPLRASDRKRATVHGKLEWHAGLQNDELDPYREAFDHDFAGFRAIWVSSRPESIVRTCALVETGDVVGVASPEDVTPQAAIDGRIWTVPGLGLEKKYPLNWCPEDAGE